MLFLRSVLLLLTLSSFFLNGCSTGESDSDALVKKIIKTNILDPKDVRLSGLTKQGMEELGPYAEQLLILINYSDKIMKPTEMKKQMDAMYVVIKETTNPKTKKDFLDSSSRALRANRAIIKPIADEALQKINEFDHTPEIKKLFNLACRKMVLEPASELLALYGKALDLIQLSIAVNNFILEHPNDTSYNPDGSVKINNPKIEPLLKDLILEQSVTNEVFAKMVSDQ